MIDFQITGPGSSIQVKTLRDEMAMAALGQISISVPQETPDAQHVKKVARVAYEIADAMLVERKKGGAS